MTYQVEFKKSAKKEFGKLPQQIQDKVLEAVRILSQNPFSEFLKIKKLKGAPSLYRVRIDDYRLVYEVEEKILTVVIIKIGHRKEVFRRL